MDVLKYMESRIRSAQFVLLVCTSGFCKKANQRSGGVGYEGTIITGEIFSTSASEKKFVPLLREGEPQSSLPSYLTSRIFIDFREDRSFDQAFEELIRHIHNAPRYRRPPLGRKPSFRWDRERRPKGMTRAKKQDSPLPPYRDNVFISGRLSSESATLFEAEVFAVIDCGFVPRTILEAADSTQPRIQKLAALIANSRFGIFDITPVGSKGQSTVPSFNVSFELGMFLSVQRMASEAKKQKFCLVLEREKYGYQRHFSDIAGLDIHSHEDNPEKVVSIISDWLRRTSNRTTIPKSKEIWRRYQMFRRDLPGMCEELHIAPSTLLFADFTTLASGWLRATI
jgi:hypothetical protein